mmetsp:Transcript_46501/g.107324  ORF Transcript_46501/g.107324 Transcript_46501/m.107324 type:complete len:438 (-) Transcript_46501:322-1635(-)
MGAPPFGGPALRESTAPAGSAGNSAAVARQSTATQGGLAGLPHSTKPVGEINLLGLPLHEVWWLCLMLILALVAGNALSQSKRDVLQFLTSTLNSLRSILATLTACAIFMVVGPALMMLNKYIMDDLHFNHPISLCSLGLVSSTVVSHLAVLLRISEIREETWKDMAGFTWLQKVGVIGLMKALTMATGNAVYLHLSFGFIQMLKAFTPLIVLIVMRLFGVALPTRAAIWCVSGIVVGTLLEVNGELQATVLGLVLMLSSEVCEATSVVLSQKILQSSKLTVLEGMYIIAPAGAACLLAGAVALELPAMLAANHHLIPLEHPWSFICAAVLGVCINFVSLVVLRLTSALTMKILNTARSVGLVVVGIVFYGEEHPWHQLTGYAVALIGFAGYNYFQIRPTAALALESFVDEAIGRVLLCCPGCCRRVPATKVLGGDA